MARDEERRPWLRSCCNGSPTTSGKNLARPAGLEPATLGLAYPLPLSRLPAGGHLGSGPSLHHCRCCTYGLYGSPRRTASRSDALPPACAGPSVRPDRHQWRPRVSSGSPSARPVKASPIQCSPLAGFRFPAEAPVHVRKYVLEGRCSIQMSYGRMPRLAAGRRILCPPPPN